MTKKEFELMKLQDQLNLAILVLDQLENEAELFNTNKIKQLCAAALNDIGEIDDAIYDKDHN